MKHANNRTNEAVVEWELASLPLGAQVRCHYPNLNGYYPHVTPPRQISSTVPYDDGWLLDITQGRCIVYVVRAERRQSWAHQTPVEYFGVDEEMATLIEEEQGKAERRRHELRPQGQILEEAYTPVQPDDGDGHLSLQKEVETVAPATAATVIPDNPKHRAIVVRWNFQLKQLVGALQAGNDAKAEQARNAIIKIADDCEAAHVTTLPNAAEHDPILADDTVFALDEVARLQVATPTVASGKQLGTMVGEGSGTMATPAAKVKGTATAATGKTPAAVASEAPIPGSFQDGKQKAKAKVAAAKQTSGEAAPAKVKEPKAPKPLNDCLDGCGAKVKGRFAMGHDAKLKSLILKIERGDEPRDSVPEIAQPFVSFTKSDVETTKVEGKDVKVQLYNCVKAPVRFSGRPDIEYAE